MTKTPNVHMLITCLFDGDSNGKQLPVFQQKNKINSKMCISNQNLSENQPLLEENVEGPPESRRRVNFRCIKIGLLITLCIGAAMAIGILIALEGKY